MLYIFVFVINTLIKHAQQIEIYYESVHYTIEFLQNAISIL